MVTEIISPVIIQEPGLLERILKHLPEPTNVEVEIWGYLNSSGIPCEIDYSDISRQIEQFVPGIKLKSCTQGFMAFGLQNPSKEKILRIVRHEPEGKYLLLRKAYWKLENHTNIEISPSFLKVDYFGQQPDYLSEILKEIGEANVKHRAEFGDIF